MGIEKYRNEVKKYLSPRIDIEEIVNGKIKELRGKYDSIVGVHVRQGDYQTWRGGAYFIEQKRVREIIDEYISVFKIDIKKTCFVIASDGQIDTEIFVSLNIFVSKENAVVDLFLLASSDTIIGSDSTFGAFASYYGNIPFFVMQNESIDWSYYNDKTKFFENKYSTMVHY